MKCVSLFIFVILDIQKEVVIHLRSGYHLMSVFDVVFYYLVTLKLATNQPHDEKTKIRKSSAFFKLLFR